MAVIDIEAKDILETVNDYLVDGYPGKAGVLLGEFLDRVIVVEKPGIIVDESVRTPPRS